MEYQWNLPNAPHLQGMPSFAQVLDGQHARGAIKGCLFNEIGVAAEEGQRTSLTRQTTRFRPAFSVLAMMADKDAQFSDFVFKAAAVMHPAIIAGHLAKIFGWPSQLPVEVVS